MTERFLYSVYGLAVESNLEIPGLSEGGGRGAPLAIRGGPAGDFAPPATPPRLAGELETLWHLGDERWLLRYDGRSMGAPSWYVEASQRGERLDVRWEESGQRGDIAAFLPGPGLALALHMRGAFPLHAGAVAADGRAALIMGPSGAGKSTTLAALVRRGFPLISDDVAVLADEGDFPAVHAGPRRLRLYRASAKAAGWDGELSRLFRHPELDDKKYLPLDDAPDLAGPIPVGSIWYLRPRAAAGSAVGIERLAPKDALARLLANVYCGRFLDRGGVQRAASRCADLAGGVPVFAVTAPDDLEALPAFAEALARAFARPG